MSPLLVLTDRTQCSGSLVDTLAAAVRCGARAIVLREKDLPATARAELASDVRRLLDPVAGMLIIAGTGPDVGGGLHLSAADPVPARRPDLLGRSCHRAEEVDRAAAEGCDYVTVSPVYLTASKPGYGPALAASGLGALCGRGVPVYALGGVTPGAVAECRAGGAAGVAVMGAIMRDPALVTAYLSNLSEVTA